MPIVYKFSVKNYLDTLFQSFENKSFENRQGSNRGVVSTFCSGYTHVLYCEIPTIDFEQSVNFYEVVLGLKLEIQAYCEEHFQFNMTVLIKSNQTLVSIYPLSSKRLQF